MLRIAFQGERGSFSEEAAQTVFGSAIAAVPCREFRDVGSALTGGSADYAVMPVENSIAGSVLPAYDVLADTRAHVLAEITRPIRLCVMAHKGASLDGLRRVISHPVALAQCSKFFMAHPHIEARAVYDTAGAAKEVASLIDATVAAIAPRTAAALYGLEILATDVQDRSDNQTRFYILGAQDFEFALPHSGAKTALMLETENKPGALLAVLEPFARAGVNLSKLESRPGGTPWTYRFFLEFEGGIDSAGVKDALHHVSDVATQVHVLGSFAVLTPP